MKNCVCGHHVSWHWVDTHRNGRCVYHITETDACSCDKFKEGEGRENELTLTVAN